MMFSTSSYDFQIRTTILAWAALACFPLLAHAQLREHAQASPHLPYPVTNFPSPTIYSIDPASGAAGTSFTIIGFSFTASNTVLFGGKSIPNVPIAWAAGINCVEGNPSCHSGINQALTVTVPSDATAGAIAESW